MYIQLTPSGAWLLHMMFVRARLFECLLVLPSPGMQHKLPNCQILLSVR